MQQQEETAACCVLFSIFYEPQIWNAEKLVKTSTKITETRQSYDINYIKPIVMNSNPLF